MIQRHREGPCGTYISAFDKCIPSHTFSGRVLSYGNVQTMTQVTQYPLTSTVGCGTVLPPTPTALLWSSNFALRNSCLRTLLSLSSARRSMRAPFRASLRS